MTARKLVFAPDDTYVPDGRYPVARPLCEDAEAKRILSDVMKVRSLSDSVWESVLYETLPGMPGKALDADGRDFGTGCVHRRQMSVKSFLRRTQIEFVHGGAMANGSRGTRFCYRAR